MAGVPDRVAVPFPLSTRVTPPGSEPDLEMAGVGLPVVVTVKLPGVPVVNVTLLAEVMAGAIPRVTGLFDALAAGPVPTLVMAATVTLYDAPLVRPVRVSVVAVELKVWLTGVPLGVGVAVTLYPVIDAVPEPWHGQNDYCATLIAAPPPEKPQGRRAGPALRLQVAQEALE